MTNGTNALNPLHAIHLKNGHYSDKTETHVGDLDTLLDTLFASTPKAGLALHFHGGLVSLGSAKEIVKNLTPEYETAGAYPVFFVWESGPIETIVNNLGDIAQESIFLELQRKAIEFALGKLGDAIAAKGAGPAPVDPARVARALDDWHAAGTGDPPYADYAIQSARLGAKAAAVPDALYEMEIQANLEADQRFKRVVEEVSNGLYPPGTQETLKGGGTRAATTTLMDPATLANLAIAPAPGQKGLISLAKLAVQLARVVYRITSRFIEGRDHGLYGTVVEEILRSFYGDKIGQALFWNQMKKDTADAFDRSPAQPGYEAGGLAFLERLSSRLAAGSQAPQITLVGHSTGAIYICHFFERADEILPSEVKLDVVLLAPAVDFKLFARTMKTYKHRIGGVRLFGMQDELEKADAMAQGFLPLPLARILYPHSLLYFVSGLLEGAEVDMPILGMKRFFDQTPVFDAANYPEVDWARHFFAQPPMQRTVWSIAAEGPGCSTSSRQHGDFDNDPATVESIQHVLSHGFAQ